MAAKTDKKTNSTLPLNTEDPTPSSNITYNSEVVAIIAGLAANEVEGIAGMCSVSGSIMSKNRNVTKGVKVEVGTEEVAVDLYVIVEYGIPIQRAASDAQENVRKAIESMTGLHVVRVDVHVQSVSFEQDKKALQAGAQQAALIAGEETGKVKLPEAGQEEVLHKEKTRKPAANEIKEEPKGKQKVDPKPKAKAEKKPEETEQKPEEGPAPDEAGEKK
ncbi:MAG: Asp23/Gls24 family envelope stress response protein [Clostridiales bacterium]|nr:Asp23/Gls24 family envelope stress response protein [Clostridiales bacterium]